MSEVRINFLNWNPDSEDENNKGLTVADNVLHDSEGYKPLHLASAGSFATTGSLAASVATVQSLIAKPVGDGTDLFCAWIAGTSINVGLNGVTATSTTTGYPLTFGTIGSSAAITAFDVCESYGKIYFIVSGAQQTSVPSTVNSFSFQGYMDY